MKQEETASQQKTLLSEGDRIMLQIICAALIAVDFLFIQGYLSLVKLDSFEQTALLCFSIAIPFLVVFILACNPLFNVETRSVLMTIIVSLISIATITINWVGLWNAFSHFSQEVGTIFFGSSVLAFLFFSSVFIMLPDLRREMKSKIPAHPKNKLG